jgi:PKD repeat protein
VTNFGDGTVSQYTVGADGSLTPLGTAVAVGVGSDNLYSATVSPGGKSLYVPNGKSVFQFSIGVDGSLTPMATPSVAGGGQAENLWFTADGKSAYLANYNGGGTSVVSEYDVSSSGSLSPKSTPSIAAGPGPASVMIPPDQGPVASFSALAGHPGSASHFNGSASRDSDGSVARYDWSFGDGTSAANAGPTPSHVYRKAGKYTVTLTVTDDSGCSTSFIYTGQTAYCNGGSAARSTRQVTIASPPVCTLKVRSNRVLAPLHKRAKKHKVKRAAGVLKLTIRCNQSVGLSLSGKIAAVLHKKHKRAKHRTFRIPRTKRSAQAARSLNLTIKLPRKALTALEKGWRETVRLTLTATNANGTTSLKKKINRLRLVKAKR